MSYVVHTLSLVDMHPHAYAHIVLKHFLLTLLPLQVLFGLLLLLSASIAWNWNLEPAQSQTRGFSLCFFTLGFPNSARSWEGAGWLANWRVALGTVGFKPLAPVATFVCHALPSHRWGDSEVCQGTEARAGGFSSPGESLMTCAGALLLALGILKTG